MRILLCVREIGQTEKRRVDITLDLDKGDIPAGGFAVNMVNRVPAIFPPLVHDFAKARREGSIFYKAIAIAVAKLFNPINGPADVGDEPAVNFGIAGPLYEFDKEHHEQ